MSTTELIEAEGLGYGGADKGPSSISATGDAGRRGRDVGELVSSWICWGESFSTSWVATGDPALPIPRLWWLSRSDPPLICNIEAFGASRVAAKSFVSTDSSRRSSSVSNRVSWVGEKGGRSGLPSKGVMDGVGRCWSDSEDRRIRLKPCSTFGFSSSVMLLRDVGEAVESW